MSGELKADECDVCEPMIIALVDDDIATPDDAVVPAVAFTAVACAIAAAIEPENEPSNADALLGNSGALKSGGKAVVI